MKHIAPVAAAVVFVLILLSSIVSTSTAQITPLPLPTAPVLQSPLVSPDARSDPYYVEHPEKVYPRSGPFVNEYGETIVKEEVIESPHHQPAIVGFKDPRHAQPVQHTQRGVCACYCSCLTLSLTSPMKRLASIATDSMVSFDRLPKNSGRATDLGQLHPKP